MKKSTKIILLVIAIILIAGIAAIAVMVNSDLKQEEKLKAELDSLYTLLNNYPLDYETLDKQISTIVTTGDCEKVERAVKNYSKDFVGYMKQFDALISNETIINALNIENIKKDGPDFIGTKKVLNESKASLDTILTNFSNCLTEEVALSYIKDIELDEYYTDIYKQYVLGDSVSEREATRDDIMKNLNDLKSLIDTEEETIDFLVNNKDNWEVENDQIAFYSDELINQYNDLISKLN